jgi:mRNA interferase RelE/StbE
MAYKVDIAPAAARQLKALSTTVQRRIVQHLYDLQMVPRPPGVIKLADDLYRIRVGDYRIIYEIQDQTRAILVLKVRHRRDIYRR